MTPILIGLLVVVGFAGSWFFGVLSGKSMAATSGALGEANAKIKELEDEKRVRDAKAIEAKAEQSAQVSELVNQLELTSDRDRESSRTRDAIASDMLEIQRRLYDKDDIDDLRAEILTIITKVRR